MTRVYDYLSGQFITMEALRAKVVDYAKNAYKRLEAKGVLPTPNVISSWNEHLTQEYEQQKDEYEYNGKYGYAGTLEQYIKEHETECAMFYIFSEGPRTEKQIKSELKRLRKPGKRTKKQVDEFIEKIKTLEDLSFYAGMGQGKIEILQAVLDNVEFESEEELFDKVWFGRCDRFTAYDGAGKEGAQRLVEQYGEDELMSWANNYSDSQYGWGVLNGKFSAVRWLGGDEWDMLERFPPDVGHTPYPAC
jgi:hypothetical protein